ncbi:MAG TPA: nickel pincer cofactor biosynthesis protein LarC [Thermoprotei archaeon]|nr:nickel pincer cofactor biosynthesis protein LarC [Thermoprotei archaeon]
MILYFDCSTAGTSGDMLLGALLDLGSNQDKIIKLADYVSKNLPGVRSVKVDVKKTSSREIMGTKVTVSVDEELVYEPGEPPHPERDSAILRKTIDGALKEFNLGEKAKAFALSAFDKLVSAEAHVHGLREKVTLHEASSADTIIDIVGVAMCIDDLKLFEGTRYCASPIALGGGDMEFSHGIMGSPAPATITILSQTGLPVIPGPFGSGELTTPTGAAILSTLVEKNCMTPIFTPKKVGYGIGQRDLGRRASFTRVILGDDYPPTQTESVSIVETDIDDASGEVVGKAVSDLMANGALDAYVIPSLRKKGRPGTLIRAISRAGDERKLALTLMGDTGTLGVRFWGVNRFVASRAMRTIKLRGKDINVKLAWDMEGKLISAKPEFDQIATIATELGVPPQILQSEVMAKALRGNEDESG